MRYLCLTATPAEVKSEPDESDDEEQVKLQVVSQHLYYIVCQTLK